jgi:asparagine synthase (glutamine-hydrolysing)
MCGISGIIFPNNKSVSATILKQMTDVIAHRGPDGDGHWISENKNIGLGHRRLSIIDLSHEADQPMHYADRYTIVFNGEIYNYVELKKTLVQQGYTFKTQSDTEVLMALYHRDKEDCLRLLDGMFSFVIYDKIDNMVFCARDRFGEKPFFYDYKEGEYFYFGSEMKCLWAAGIPKKINNRMLFNYLSFAYIENPNDGSETFFEGCTRLPHSHFIKINCNTLNIEIKQYYDIDWKNIDQHITEKQASEKFKELFYTSVSRRLRSDVAVGSSLSGGLDSSLVVCVIDELKKGSNQRQDTFSAVFPGFAKDERKYMDYVTAVTNVNPHYITPTDEGLIADLQKLSYHQEEPYVSASIYVQYSVMQLAKQHNVTVLLDGQGADEILAGYHHFFPAFFNEQKKVGNHKSQYNNYMQLHQQNAINGITKFGIGDMVRKISPSLVAPLKKLKNIKQQFSNPILNKEFYNAYKNDVYQNAGNQFSTLGEALYNSVFKGNLQNLLRYADRNSMAHSREVRLPFLSHELVDFLFTLPSSYKINNGWTKWIMRETFDILPKEIGWRLDKIGFEAPQQSWLNNKAVQQQILESRLKLVDKNYLNKKFVSNSTSNSSIHNTKSWDHLLSGALLG